MLTRGLEESNVTLIFGERMLPNMSFTAQESTPLLARFVIESFEIWPKNNKNFRDLATNYYENIYLEHITKNPKKTPAPQKFWPFSFQFYLCMPIKTFECDIQNVNQNPQIVINKLKQRAANIWGIDEEAIEWENGEASPAGDNAGKFPPLT